MNEWKKWMNEWMNEWMNAWMNEWMKWNEMNEMNEMNDMNEMNEMNEWITHKKLQYPITRLEDIFSTSQKESKRYVFDSPAIDSDKFIICYFLVVDGIAIVNGSTRVFSLRILNRIIHFCGCL